MIETGFEPLVDFQLRGRRWIEANLRSSSGALEGGETGRKRDAELQAKIFDAGFAGLAIPKAYGGAGLTLDHQRIWALETAGFDTPKSYMVSIGMMLPTLLEFGSEAVKARHIPRMLRGEEVWIQLLSEPSGGSDMAGALTRAVPDGNAYILNGSKMWSSGADWSDYGICLARVNWDAPKHQGLGMFTVCLKGPGVTIKPIRPVTGEEEAHLFIEYLDNVRVEPDYVLAGEGRGWIVAQRLLFHERNAAAGVGYGYGLGGDQLNRGLGYACDVPVLAEQSGSFDDPAVTTLIVDDHIDGEVRRQLAERINAGMRTGKLHGQWGSLLKLRNGIDGPIQAEAALAVSASDGVIWTGQNQGGEPGLHWLRIRGHSIAGGSNEIQRNIVSERLLGLPREPGQDKSTPFSTLVQKQKPS